MPGNTITVNGEEWYVGDSKMPQLMEVLEKVGTSKFRKKGKIEVKDTKVENQYNL